MVSFSDLDIFIVLLFFLVVIVIGFLPRSSKEGAEYLLSGRRVGLFLFILTNVATWYGGILGVGEFSYSYGLVSWFTQGLPYYLFAIIFALLFAKKIRESSLFTIPDKIEKTYGRQLSITAAVLIFILVSPAPYILMIANLISMIFQLPLLPSLIIAGIFSAVYLFKGGLKADIVTDAFEFFVMFLGFIIVVLVAYTNFGGIDFLISNLPETHLTLTGNASPTFIIVWFLISLWTFADPGFHQRCYSAKSGNVAVKGIIISVVLWALFDFLTTSTGLYAKAVLPDLENPVLSFPALAELILSPGLKGLFYAALFATIMSTLNSFLFISATTFSKDFISKLKPGTLNNNLRKYTRIGLLVTTVISIVMAYFVQSVIELWYTIGSLCIPGLIFVVIGAYYEKFRLSERTAFIQVIASTTMSVIWWITRKYFNEVSIINEIEPMIIGMVTAAIIQMIGKKRAKSPR